MSFTWQYLWKLSFASAAIYDTHIVLPLAALPQIISRSLLSHSNDGRVRAGTLDAFDVKNAFRV